MGRVPVGLEPQKHYVHDLSVRLCPGVPGVDVSQGSSAVLACRNRLLGSSAPSHFLAIAGMAGSAPLPLPLPVQLERLLERRAERDKPD